MKELEFEDIKGLLELPKRITILSHTNPDGDAVGSSLGLSAILKNIGHDVTVILPTDYPPLFRFLDHIDETIISVVNRREATHAVDKADMLFLLDFNGLDRIDHMGPIVQEAKGVKVMIDHHLDPEPIADWMLSDPGASSTSELIYVFTEMLGKLKHLDLEAATALFVGILTDTGSFKFATNPRVFNVVSHLKEIGVNDYILQNRLFNSMTEKQLRLIGHCIANRMELLDEIQTGIIHLTKEDFKDFNIKRGDTEGIVNYILMMRKMRVAIFVTDQGNIKLSFRSKGNVSVQELARDYFGGGGHRNASGGQSKRTLEETLNLLKEILPGYLETQGIVKVSTT